MDYKPGREPFIVPLDTPQPLLPIGQCLGAAFQESSVPLPEKMLLLLADLGEIETTDGKRNSSC